MHTTYGSEHWTDKQKERLAFHVRTYFPREAFVVAQNRESNILIHRSHDGIRFMLFGPCLSEGTVRS